MYDKNVYTNQATRLYHLKPIGIGTPHVESLPSYIKRLAEAHCVSPGSLMEREIIPHINKGYIRTSHFIGGAKKKYINAIASNLTKAIVEILEEKTCNDGLIYLTMSSWGDFLSPKLMFRKNQAWCPICYEESLQSGQPLYEQLIWSFNDVDICKIHKVRLMKKCPYCGREFSGFNGASRIGYCDSCKTWLGLKEYQDSQITTVNEEWQSWVYDNIGQILSITPMIKDEDNLFGDNIRKVLNSINISQRELEKQLNISRAVINDWTSGSKPLLNTILRFSFKFECFVTELLTNDVYIPINQINKRKIVPKGQSMNNIEIGKLKKVVSEAIDANKGMSLTKLAITTGVSVKILKKYFPNEVVKIKEDYNKYLEEGKLAKSKLIKDTMRSLLQMGVFPSRKAISRELGKRTVTNDDERKVWIETLEELGCTIEDYN